jgi:hypothetical protein
MRGRLWRLMGEFYEYLLALAGYGKWLLSGGPYLLETLVKRLKPSWIERLNSVVSAKARLRAETGIVMMAIFFAGFLAWRDEHIARQGAERKILSLEQAKPLRSQNSGIILNIANPMSNVELIRQKFHSSEIDEAKQEYVAWANKTYALANLDISYAIQFKNSHGSALTGAPAGHPELGGYLQEIEGKKAYLNSLMDQLRRG